MKTNFTLLTFLLAINFVSYGQSASFGSAYALTGGEMAIFGQHNFQNGTGTLGSGIVGSIRTTSIGKFDWTSTGSWINASDNAFVDGYCTTYRTDAFTFPIGDNNSFRPAAVSISSAANPTSAAYYAADPSIAITSNLAGGNYPVLPAGGPFSRSSRNSSLSAIDNVEYWDIDGNTSAKITLTWNAASNINTLTGGNMGALTIAGWNGSQWVPVSSIVDVSQLLQTTSASSFTGTYSSVTSGSITTATAIVPSSYTIYTLAALVYTPLPIKFQTFTVTASGNNAILNWLASEEQDVTYYAIEKSIDGINFSGIAVVSAKGNSTGENNYTYSDNITNNQSAIIYYRIRSVNVDNQSIYSPTRTIKTGKQDEKSISIITYPNPVSNELRITIPASWQDKKVSYLVISSNGQLSKKVETDGSNQTEIVNVSNLAPGAYFVIVKCNGETAQQKIIKQ